MFKKSSNQVANILAASLSDDTLAAVLNDLVGVESNDRLSDADARWAELLFDRLTDLRPDVVALAVGQ